MFKTRSPQLVQASPCVLIVDRSEETREVLKTALERRGILAVSASRIHQGTEIARTRHPDLIVLDLEAAPSSPEDICSKFVRAATPDEPPMVLLGTMKKCPADPRCEFVSKPYHYGPLVRRIEEILEKTDRNLPEAA